MPKSCQWIFILQVCHFKHQSRLSFITGWNLRYVSFIFYTNLTLELCCFTLNGQNWERLNELIVSFLLWHLCTLLRRWVINWTWTACPFLFRITALFHTSFYLENESGLWTTNLRFSSIQGDNIRSIHHTICSLILFFLFKTLILILQVYMWANCYLNLP
jgi:hypothetical protein